MILNNLKVIAREILRNKFLSAINLGGLSLGLVGAILIWLWVWDELSYDRFYDNSDDIYMLVNRNIDDNGNSIDFVESPAPMADYLVSNIPEIEKAVRIDYFYRGGLIQNGDDIFKELGAAVDSSFFEVFNIPFVNGNKNNLFNNTKSIVISESMAKRYYGKDNPVGQILKIKAYGDNYKTVVVTGVFKDFPNNSSIKLDFVVPFLLEENDYLDNWNVSIYATFVLLNTDSDFDNIQEKISLIYEDVIDDVHYTSYLFPLTKLHLSSQLSFFNNANKGSIKLIYILVLIAFLILLIACINYMNLATARSVKKNKEVSIKRILGISRKKLFGGFLSESIMYSLISFHVALVLVEVIRPIFNNITGKHITINYFDPQLIGVAIVIILIIGLISGVYPYLHIVSKKPVLLLKGSIPVGRKSIYSRNILVIFQFTTSIILIIFSSVVLKQVNFIYTRDLGFNKENIMMINSSDLGDKVKIVKDEILKYPNVISVTNGNSPMRAGWPDSWSWEGKISDSRLDVIQINADKDYLKTINIDLLEGRFFTDDFSDKSTIVINQKFAIMIGEENILGKKIYFRDKPYKIIGVTDNFYSNHFSEEIRPLAYFNESAIWYLIKVRNINSVETVNYIKSIFKKSVPDRPFEFTSLQKQFDGLYSSEVNTGKLFVYFSFLTIFISCMGLIGISIFTTEQRIKEIGIRKTLGASTRMILRILNRKFVRLVVIAFVISCPVAYYFVANWLQNFVYRIELSWWIFILAGIIVLIIAILTVSCQSYRAARKNPVESLRYE
jgi:ABC-type antimicrobial peptide transport system permease subunit